MNDLDFIAQHREREHILSTAAERRHRKAQIACFIAILVLFALLALCIAL